MSDDALEDALRTLPEHDVDAWRREHVRKRAHQALCRPTASKLACVYWRVLEPALLAIVCCVHLAWALGVVAAILLR